MFNYIPSNLLAKLFFIGSGFLLVFALMQQVKTTDKFMYRERYVLLDDKESVTIEPNRSKDVTKDKIKFVVSNLANALFSRNPYGPDSDVLAKFLYTTETQEQIRDYLEETRKEYKKEDYHEKVEIFDIKAIEKDDTEMIATVKGQVIRISSRSDQQSLEGYEFEARFSVSRITNISEGKMFPFKCHKFFVQVYDDGEVIFTVGTPYEEA